MKKLINIDNLIFIDVLNELLEDPNLNTYYSDDNEYGGHFSKEGNEKIASIIHNKLKNYEL